MPRQPDGAAWPTDGRLHSSGRGGTAPFAAYVHVPFCTVRCGYCDFNTYTTGFGDGADLATYASSVEREIALSTEVLEAAGWARRPLRSIFLGGGTPSLLEPEAVAGILRSLEDAFSFADGVEVTLEANPDTLNGPRARGFVDAGVNRFSIGMQSAVPEVLKTLDRTHNPESLPTAVAAARDANAQVSVDLIYGAPGETLRDWRTSLEAAISLRPDHVSAYSLIIEEGTKMGRDLAAGLIPPSDPDLDAEKYELANEMLAAGGYRWYEISNFARSTQTQSQHNLAYWRDWDWWGYGPGAHSHIGDQRWWNVKHPRAYAGKLKQGLSPGFAGETLSEADRRVERIMLGIRTSEGLPVGLLDPVAVGRLEGEKLLALDGGSAETPHVGLTVRGRLLADYVTRVLLGWE